MYVVKSFKELGRVPIRGDRVKIVDKKIGSYWAPEGMMDKYLGTIMTIRRSSGPGYNNYYANMYEDKDDVNYPGGWTWFSYMIEGLVIEDQIDVLEDPAVWVDEAAFADLFK